MCFKYIYREGGPGRLIREYQTVLILHFFVVILYIVTVVLKLLSRKYIECILGEWDF